MRITSSSDEWNEVACLSAFNMACKSYAIQQNVIQFNNSQTFFHSTSYRILHLLMRAAVWSWVYLLWSWNLGPVMRLLRWQPTAVSSYWRTNREVQNIVPLMHSVSSCVCRWASGRGRYLTRQQGKSNRRPASTSSWQSHKLSYLAIVLVWLYLKKQMLISAKKTGICAGLSVKVSWVRQENK